MIREYLKWTSFLWKPPPQTETLFLNFNKEEKTNSTVCTTLLLLFLSKRVAEYAAEFLQFYRDERDVAQR